MIVKNAKDIESTIDQAIQDQQFTLNRRKTKVGRITSPSGFELLGLRIHATDQIVKCTPRRKVRRRLRAAAMAGRSDKIDKKLARCITAGCMHYHIGHTYGLRVSLVRGSGLSIVKIKIQTGVTDVRKLADALTFSKV